jgi:hypothetical protein
MLPPIILPMPQKASDMTISATERPSQCGNVYPGTM